MTARVLMRIGETYVYGSSLRAAPIYVTLERAERVAHRFGITRVTDVTRLDRLGIPVCVSVRPAAPRGSLCVNAGKGLSPEEARVGAIMEAIEFAMAEQGAAAVPIHIGTARDVLDGRDRPDAVLDLCPRIREHVALDARMACVEARELRRGGTCLVPAELVFLPFPHDIVSHRVFGSSSNGLCSGNTVAEATLHGLCEVIERDITSFSLMRDESRLVDPSTYPPPAAELLERVRSAGLKLFVRTRLNEFGIPWFAATLIDPDHLSPLYVNGGYGCHPSASIALVRAITEAAQSRLSYIHGGRDDLIVRHDHVRMWTSEETASWVRRIASAAADHGGMAAFDDIPDLDGECRTVEAALAAIFGALAREGFERICQICYTAPGEDLQVVRIIVPGLEYFSETSPRVGRRLRDYVQRSRS